MHLFFIMNTDNEKSSDEVCANCGVAAIDNVKLTECNGGCDLVKYCNDECQKNHKGQHEEECKKRKTDLRDRDLFEQPDGSHRGECPICCLPQSIDPKKSMLMRCCCKSICNGCCYVNQMREFRGGLQQRCPFCREPAPNSVEESDKNVKKRIKKNDPAAFCDMGKKHSDEGDYETALKYLTKAAELGNAEAHYCLSIVYVRGEGVEKDEEKYMYHSEEAAIRGHPHARHNLGIEECNNGNFERARKHFIIAANLGNHDSLKELRELYADGHASKEEYAAALHGYQASVDATKSAEREVAEACYEIMVQRGR